MKNAVAVFATMLLAFAAAGALAQNYPVKSIRFYVGYAPGGGTDIMARAVAAKLTESLGQQVIVDNRPGANANLAAEIAAKAPADGYTVLMISVSHAISKPFYKKLGYDLERDFTPLVDISIVPQFVIVHPSLPARTLKDLIALAKKQPGQITFASSGDGSPEHIAAELLKSMAKIDMIHVPYKGGSPAAIALISGEVAVGFNTAPVAIPYIKSGRVRALAVTGEKRNAALPDVPTVAESGVPGYSMNTWYGAVMPAGTPAAIIAKLNAEINRILKMPDIRERLASLGADPVGGSPEQFGGGIKSEVAKFTKVVREANLGNR